jgi:hypothetical protein
MLPTPERNDLGLRHEADCRRWNHYGPCQGPLRHERPETVDERHRRVLDAIAAVIVRAVLSGDSVDPYEVAQECLAAAETGI